jgi:N-acetyl sugar amidotransferase
MDTSDASIVFDEKGYCSNCNSAIELAKSIWKADEEGEKHLDRIFEEIRDSRKKKEYNCVIGLSGGVDSSYLAYIAVKKELRPLVVHVDCGWNSEMAVKNIENIVNKLNLELHTFVVNWEEMKDLQRSFFRASVPDLDIPQDHAIFAALYDFADKNDIKYVLNGFNFATECIMPSVWGHQAMDYRHLSSIHKLFGKRPLKEYPHLNFFERYVYFTLIRKMSIIYPLNYIKYNKTDAMEKMTAELNWQYYGGKHYESRFTKFFQSYYLPEKFNIDKRRAHLSSMIISGQMKREEALRLIAAEPYNKDEISDDLEFVAKKLDWSVQEFKDIIALPSHRHQDYPTNDNLFLLGLKVKKAFKREPGTKLSNGMFMIFR